MAGTDYTVASDVAVSNGRVYALRAGQVARLITAASSTAKLQVSTNGGYTYADWAFGTLAASTTKALMATGPTLIKIVQVTGTATFEVDVPAANNLGAFVIGGVGDPTSAVDAPQGTLFLRTDGGASTTLYVKTGALIANWTAK